MYALLAIWYESLMMYFIILFYLYLVLNCFKIVKLNCFKVIFTVVTLARRLQSVARRKIPSFRDKNFFIHLPELYWNEQNLEIIRCSDIYLIQIDVTSLFGVTVITNLRSKDLRTRQPSYCTMTTCQPVEPWRG